VSQTKHWEPSNNKSLPATHLPGLTNPRITLCQEYAMRAMDWDNHARVAVAADTPLDCTPATGRYREPDGDIATPFRDVAVFLGIDEAVRVVTRCWWVSRSDFKSEEPIDCVECAEVARA
jgi:hypothetical protein